MAGKLKGLLIGGALIAGLAIGGVAIAGAGDDDDTEKPITGQALGKASAAALDHTGAGRVTDTEVGDEEGYYEVEVTLKDGSQVDVHLDRGFNVLGQATDEDRPDDRDAAGED